MAPNRGARMRARREIGAVDETRTRDLHLGKVALYQLSYYRMVFGAGDGNRTHVASLEGWNSTIELHPQMERKTRFELATPALARRCSTTELFPQALMWCRISTTCFSIVLLLFFVNTFFQQ